MAQIGFKDVPPRPVVGWFGDQPIIAYGESDPDLLYRQSVLTGASDS